MAARSAKRNRKGEARQPSRNDENSSADVTSAIYQAFLQFQCELDLQHDKHERLVKLSRDVTIESKRTIFLLHRTTSGDKESALSEAAEKLKDIEGKKFKSVAQELNSEDPYKYLRAFSPGLQEYIEALSFYNYLKTGGLISLSEVQKRLEFEIESMPENAENASDDQKLLDTTVTSDQNKQTMQVHVPPIEYMLGIADLTGEMMRLAIANVTKGNFDECLHLCQFMRTVHDAFLSYGNVSRELNRKMWTLKQSLQKVENACYTLQVRGSEIPKHMLADVLSTVEKSTNMYLEDSSLVDT